jgi:hypothetical protein
VAFLASGCAVTAKITDVSGRSYDVKSVRLTGGSSLKVVCGGTRIDVPLKAVSNVSINTARIFSIDGRPHYGVEILMGDGSVIGGNVDDGENCVVCADNGFRGKVSKAAYSASLSDVSNVQILGKDDKKQAEEGEGEDGEDE